MCQVLDSRQQKGQSERVPPGMPKHLLGLADRAQALLLLVAWGAGQTEGGLGRPLEGLQTTGTGHGGAHLNTAGLSAQVSTAPGWGGGRDTGEQLSTRPQASRGGPGQGRGGPRPPAPGRHGNEAWNAAVAASSWALRTQSSAASSQYPQPGRSPEQNGHSLLPLHHGFLLRPPAPPTKQNTTGKKRNKTQQQQKRKTKLHI